MRQLLAGILGLALAGSGAFAEDDFAAVVRRLGDEDAAVRDEAEQQLIDSASIYPDRLRACQDDPDPEIAARVRRVLRTAGIFDDPAKTRRCAEIFAELSEWPQAEATREQLLRELVALGEPAIRRLALELEVPAHLEVMRPDLSTHPPDGWCTVSYRNPSRRAAWFPAASLRFDCSTAPIGALRRLGGRRLIRRQGSGTALPSLDHVLRTLARCVRVAPGASSVLGSSRIYPHAAVRVTARLEVLPVTSYSAEACGVELTTPEAPDVEPWTISTVLLPRRARSESTVKALPGNDGPWTILLENGGATLPPPPPPDRDPFWWIAEAQDGTILGSGPARELLDPDSDPAEFSLTSVPITGRFPEGTFRIRVGFDTQLTSIVSEPVEIPAR